MKFLHPAFVEVLKTLIDYHVEFLLIGGYAVNYHGFGRPTGDMDLWLRPDNANKQRCLAAFQALNYSRESIESINTLNFEKAQVFFIGEVPLRIDFLTKVNIVDFEDAWKKKNFLSLDELNIPVIDYEHLVLSKISTGRTRDKLDLEELQKVRRHKNRK